MRLVFFLLVGLLLSSACGPSQAQLAATAQAAVEATQTARPTPTAIPNTPTPESTPTLAATATPAFTIGSTQIREADNMTMLYVPAGEFTMGYGEGLQDQRPSHTVYLDAYWIDKTEVTMGQYALCVGAGKCRRPKGAQPSEDSPVVNGTWDDANSYCAFVGAPLPTEAEWEKAARGTDERMYPWGSEMDKARLALFTWDNRMPAVGLHSDGASPYGVLDMAGGAFEWTADWYAPSYYSQSPKENPTGPRSGKQHVIRGGWWEWCPSYYTCNLNPTYSSTVRNGTGYYGRGGSGPAWVYYPGAGFRCASK